MDMCEHAYMMVSRWYWPPVSVKRDKIMRHYLKSDYFKIKLIQVMSHLTFGSLRRVWPHSGALEHTFCVDCWIRFHEWVFEYARKMWLHFVWFHIIKVEKLCKHQLCTNHNLKLCGILFQLNHVNCSEIVSLGPWVSLRDLNVMAVYS